MRCKNGFYELLLTEDELLAVRDAVVEAYHAQASHNKTMGHMLGDRAHKRAKTLDALKESLKNMATRGF